MKCHSHNLSLGIFYKYKKKFKHETTPTVPVLSGTPSPWYRSMCLYCLIIFNLGLSANASLSVQEASDVNANMSVYKPKCNCKCKYK